jgi:hypothetical protein
LALLFLRQGWDNTIPDSHSECPLVDLPEIERIPITSLVLRHGFPALPGNGTSSLGWLESCRCKQKAGRNQSPCIRARLQSPLNKLVSASTGGSRRIERSVRTQGSMRTEGSVRTEGIGETGGSGRLQPPESGPSIQCGFSHGLFSRKSENTFSAIP